MLVLCVHSSVCAPRSRRFGADLTLNTRVFAPSPLAPRAASRDRAVSARTATSRWARLVCRATFLLAYQLIYLGIERAAATRMTAVWQLV